MWRELGAPELAAAGSHRDWHRPYLRVADLRTGRHVGTATIRGAVQTETIQKLDAARISEKKTDEEVVRTPSDVRVDGVR